MRQTTSLTLRAAGVVLALLALACKPSSDRDGDSTGTDGGAAGDSGAMMMLDGGGMMLPEDAGDVMYPNAEDGIVYRDDLAAHPGCTTADLSYPAAAIAGYNCSAKEYLPAAEDTTKPIVLLVHGNSDTPSVWEKHTSGSCDPVGPTQGVDMLAERLVAASYRTYAVDLRFDKVDDPAGNNETENAAKNMDHGWGVPIVQHFIAKVLEANPDRRISIIGHSFGATVTRDAVRRLYINDKLPIFARIDDMVLLAGAHHGVSSFALCGANPTMRGQVACEMGNRAAYSPTDFTAPLNGEEGAFETPCADGQSAFGRPDACGGNTVDYLTIVMQDKADGEQQDIFVSEASSRLEGADNQTIGLQEFDQSDYFFCGLFKDHYGPARALPAMDLIMSRLSD